jgi:di/tricarboxylate transporter
MASSAGSEPGNVDQTTWWKLGAMAAIMSMVVNLVTGLPYCQLFILGGVVI